MLVVVVSGFDSPRSRGMMRPMIARNTMYISTMNTSVSPNDSKSSLPGPIDTIAMIRITNREIQMKNVDVF